MTTLRRPGLRTSAIAAAVAMTWITAMALSAPAAEHLICVQCGMLVDVAAPFSAKLTKKEQTLYFCDIGDLLAYLRDKGMGAANAQVKDYRSGEWIEAGTAYYVHAPKRFITPMGWGLASFKQKKDAEEFGTASDFATLSRNRR